MFLFKFSDSVINVTAKKLKINWKLKFYTSNVFLKQPTSAIVQMQHNIL